MASALAAKNCPSCKRVLELSVLRGFLFSEVQNCRSCKAEIMIRKDAVAAIQSGSYFVGVMLGIALAENGGALAFFLASGLGLMLYLLLIAVALLFFDLQLRAPVDDAAQNYRLAIVLLVLLGAVAVVFGTVLRSGA